MVLYLFMTMLIEECDGGLKKNWVNVEDVKTRDGRHLFICISTFNKCIWHSCVHVFICIFISHLPSFFTMLLVLSISYKFYI